MLTICLALMLSAPAPNIALKVVERRDGFTITEPVIHGSIRLALQPENVAARAVAKGETLICKVHDRKTDAVVEGEKATLQIVYVTCGDGKYSVAGLVIE